MRSKIARDLLAETSPEVVQFVRKYGDIVVRIHQILQDKGITQRELAERLGKQPSEISKWLSGNHNLTLRSLAKLEAELGEDIIYVPRQHTFDVGPKAKVRFTVHKNIPMHKNLDFVSEVQTVKEECEAQVA